MTVIHNMELLEDAIMHASELNTPSCMSMRGPTCIAPTNSANPRRGTPTAWNPR
jgi:hypothetical protein